MNIAAIDTHAVVLELKAAGFTDAQAEAVTRVVRKAQDIDVSNLATKSDLAAVRTDLQLQFAEFKADIERSLGNNKVEMLKWIVGATGVQTVVILGALVTPLRMLAH